MHLSPPYGVKNLLNWMLRVCWQLGEIRRFLASADGSKSGTVVFYFPLILGVSEDPNFDDSSSPLLCYHYAAQHAGAVSTWTCDGTQRNAFEYTIFFTLAGSNDNLAAAASTEFTHCVTGDLK